MINLLPYNRRIQLKSQYKMKLVVVALFATAIAILPFVIVTGVMLFLQYSQIGTLSKNYEQAVIFREEQGVTDLSKTIISVNELIASFQKNLGNARSVSNTIEHAISIRPAMFKTTSFEFKTSPKDGNILTINGISDDRAGIIEYINLLGMGHSNICKKVSVPVKTYIKKTNVPFIISCLLQYENK